MSVRTTAALTISDLLWDGTDMLDALAARDVAQVFRLVQRATHASQTTLGVATGLSQAQVSEITSGARRVSSIDVLTRICTGLSMPRHARITLLLGERDQMPAEQDVSGPQVARTSRDQCADVTAIYSSRSDFVAELPPHVLFDSATDIRASGLSLNLICQQYADNRLLKLLAAGTRLRCLFLDPAGEAIRRQEREDDFPDGHLSALTELNIQNLAHRIRDRLPAGTRDHLTIGVYDESVRANVLLIDDRLCVVQHYLPRMRGVDCPTMVIERSAGPSGLYPIFDEMFSSLWNRSRKL
ncbi:MULTISPECIES: DUF5919 domain-containing protein [Micromonospora]|uniref:DUF5919 domain-containing protein n=1 Tax=Micromonospora TaxID=1873 RepID=UPI001B38D261|nr:MULTISPECIES: DUF5919 domain-containing protein [Micromonospora]MBQ1034735.1 XRE family transcriptional regulator [Micromonospora sp. C81]WTI23085.1 DUF5919 domain-containing protein [Micromonospora zamorensis]